jgi:hypothetical protein
MFGIRCLRYRPGKAGPVSKTSPVPCGRVEGQGATLLLLGAVATTPVEMDVFRDLHDAKHEELREARAYV